jgi:hypothetical protein
MLSSKAQEHFFNVNNGYVETGTRYTGLVTPVNPIPTWQFYLNSEQQADFGGVPVTLQGGFTNLVIGQQEKAWYPNYMRVVYNKDDFQKKLQERYIQMLEQKAQEEYKKQQKKKQNLFHIKQLDEWLTKADTAHINHKINSLKQKLKSGKNKNNKKDWEKELKKLENQLQQIKGLYAKKENLLNENLSINVNDSILKALEKAKISKIDFKGKKMKSLMKMSDFQQFMYSLEEFKGGRFYLDIRGISEYTSIDGLQIKFKPGNLYVQTVTGKIFQSSYFNLMMPDDQNQNKVYVLGASVGRNNGKQNIGLHYYYFTGNTSLVNQIRNTVIGAAFDQKLNRKIKAGILLTGSQSFNANQQQDIIQIQGVQIVYPVSVQNTVSDIVGQNKSILYQTGYRMELNTELKNIISQKDRWDIKYEKVSPFYQSMAMPYMLKDYHGISIQNQWNLFRNKWMLTNNYQYKEDNLSRLKPVNTYWTVAGVEIDKRGEKINLKSAYNIIYRNSLMLSVYHNLLQTVQLKSKKRWRFIHTISANVLLNDSAVATQQYNYQMSFNPAKKWNVSTITGISIIDTTNYLNFNVQPTFRAENWNIGLAFQMMVNKTKQHQNTTLKLGWKLNKNMNFYIESGYGNSPQYNLLNNQLQFVSYWNGNVALRYHWN